MAGYSKRPDKVPPSRCSKVGCRQLQPCGEHPAGWRNSKSEPLPPNWGSLRNATRKAARGLCRKCGVDCWSTGSCDHIVNRANGGTHHQSNLQWLCKNCHDIKSRRESKDGNRDSKRRRTSGIQPGRDTKRKGQLRKAPEQKPPRRVRRDDPEEVAEA